MRWLEGCIYMQKELAGEGRPGRLLGLVHRDAFRLQREQDQMSVFKGLRVFRKDI